LKIAVVGGKLQGTEATYLAHKAGWEVVLIDRRPTVPAMGLADEFHQIDVVDQASKLPSLLKKTDLVIPAVEDALALLSLRLVAEQENIPLAYDEASYRVSSSKIRSDRLFKDLDLPTPRVWPRCDPPFLVKPSGASGSHGVRKISSRKDLDSFIAARDAQGESWVVQEFLEGPSYSLEVLGCRRKFVGLQTTTIEVDDLYDCKRVLAPADLPPALKADFGDLSKKIAADLDLRGIMDVEVILHQDQLKVLEIDARLPSQTPTAVYHSTGINMIELLADVFVRGSLPDSLAIDQEKAVIYEHIKVTPETMEVAGEHIMAGAEPLRIRKGFFGADEAITDFKPGKDQWVATLIFVGKDPQKVQARREATINELKKYFGLNVYRDPVPGKD
jgi:pyrrolysine biosynthesis protein PylC